MPFIHDNTNAKSYTKILASISIVHLFEQDCRETDPLDQKIKKAEHTKNSE